MTRDSVIGQGAPAPTADSPHSVVEAIITTNAPTIAVLALLVTDREAAALCGLGRSTWHRLHAAGKTPAAVKLGRSVRWNRAELESWIAAGCPPRREWEALNASRKRLRGIS